MKRLLAVATISMLALLVLARSVHAVLTPAQLAKVGYAQRLGAQLPLADPFRDQTGAPVTLGQELGGKPAVLLFWYAHCPQLCPLVLDGTADSLRQLSFMVGRQYDVVAISIDPTDTPAQAAKKQAMCVARYDRPGSAEGWRFLTGSAASIQQIERAAGFRAAYDAQHRQYAHAAGLLVATGRGRISQVFYGVQYDPRALRLALVQASNRHIGSPIDDFLLLCCQFDPASGRYDLAIARLFQIVGATLMGALALLVAGLMRHQRRAWPGKEERS